LQFVGGRKVVRYAMGKFKSLRNGAQSKGKAYNTCTAPQVTYHNFRGAGTRQARVMLQPIGYRPGPQTWASLTAKQPQTQSQPAI